MLLALITAALAETITCEAIEGPALRYTYYSKSGGNMPREDTLMEQEIWTLGERTLLVMERTYGGLTTRRGGLDWRWDSGATVIEGIVGGRLNRVITYTTRVSVVETNGEALGPGLGTEATAKMRCVRDPESGIP